MEDIPALAALWHQGWHEAHAAIVPAGLTKLRTLGSFAARLTADLSGLRVGRIDGALAGFHVTKNDEVYQFFVAPIARGTGFASELIADAEAALFAAGTRRAWLACSIGNDRAAGFYRKAGWVNVGTEQVALETSAGPFPLEVWRFEKPL